MQKSQQVTVQGIRRPPPEIPPFGLISEVGFIMAMNDNGRSYRMVYAQIASFRFRATLVSERQAFLMFQVAQSHGAAVVMESELEPWIRNEVRTVHQRYCHRTDATHYPMSECPDRITQVRVGVITTMKSAYPAITIIVGDTALHLPNPSDESLHFARSLAKQHSADFIVQPGVSIPIYALESETNPC